MRVVDNCFLSLGDNCCQPLCPCSLSRVTQCVRVTEGKRLDVGWGIITGPRCWAEANTNGGGVVVVVGGGLHNTEEWPAML